MMAQSAMTALQKMPEKMVIYSMPQATRIAQSLMQAPENGLVGGAAPVTHR